MVRSVKSHTSPGNPAESPAFLLETLSRLERELPATLCYHNINHTKDVICEATALAGEDGCTPRECYLIHIAATLHDVGFLVTRKGHEEEGAKFATETLTLQSDLTTDEILLVAQMIRDTCLVPQNGTLIQVSNSKLSPYLLDADLANFGRDDFSEKTELVRQELAIPATKAFYEGVERLVAAHKWQSSPAMAKWQAQKEKNLSALRTRLGAM